MLSKQICPCGVQKSYLRCCGDLHAGMPAKTALQLMRARYCAYVLHRDDYVLQTWHPATRPESLHTIDTFGSNIKWLGLTIKKTREISAQEAEVEFIARYKSGGTRAVCLHERSRFINEHGVWFYVDGVFL